MKDISYSNGSIVKNAVIVIWDDLHAEGSGFFRAFWTDSPDGSIGSPVIGYCSPGGSHKTCRDAAREALRFYPGETIYRNGKPI